MEPTPATPPDDDTTSAPTVTEVQYYIPTEVNQHPTPDNPGGHHNPEIMSLDEAATNYYGN